MIRTKFVIPALLVSLLAAGCGSDDEGSAEGAAETGEKQVDLQYAHYIGPKAAQSVSTAGWADAIEEKTGGSVSVKFFYQGSLLGPTDMLEGVSSGRADVGYLASSYYPSELPLSSIVEIPFTTSNPEAQAQTFYDLYQSNADFQAEYEKQGVKVLTFNPLSATILGSKEPIEGTAAVKDKQIRVAGGVGTALQALGAKPVNLGAPEIYEGLQRGLIDGYSSFPFEVIADLQLQEVAPNVADPGLGQFAISATVMNLKTWESLSDAARQAITEESEAHVARATKDLAAVEQTVCDALLEADAKIVLWSEADIAAWKQQLGSTFEDTWLKNAQTSVDKATAEAFKAEYLEKLASYEQGSSYEPGVRRCASEQQ